MGHYFLDILYYTWAVVVPVLMTDPPYALAAAPPL